MHKNRFVALCCVYFLLFILNNDNAFILRYKYTASNVLAFWCIVISPYFTAKWHAYELSRPNIILREWNFSKLKFRSNI